MLPINWHLTPAEVKYILNDGQAKIFFVGGGYQPLARDLIANLPPIENVYTLAGGEPGIKGFSDLLQGWGGLVPATDVSQDDPYLIIHTAAVAGKPRGATLSHGNIIAGDLQDMAVMGLGESDSYIHPAGKMSTRRKWKRPFWRIRKYPKCPSSESGTPSGERRSRRSVSSGKEARWRRGI
jgi:acyl-CoA synthetase (AMP-forming)/AMP-acid ligase II